MANMTLDWLHIAVLLGATQGFLLAAVLATQRRNRTANRLLAFLMFAFSVFMLSAVYHATGLVEVAPHFFGWGYLTPFVFGQLIYLYAVTASDRTRWLRWWDGLHFLPFAAVLIGSLPMYLMSGAEKVAFYHEVLQGMRTPLMKVADPVRYVCGISYTVATILFLRRHRARVKDSYSSIERVNLQWLLRLTAATAAIWALATILEVTAAVNHPFFRRGDDLISLALAILVYGIGYMALRQPEIFNFAVLDYLPPQLGLLSAPSSPTPGSLPAAPSVPPSDTAARYERSGLTEKEAAALKDALLRVMDTDRLYQNSSLTLADLAERLDTTPHKLSEVLNAQLNQTFYDFVNAYRVRDVQRRIADAQLKNLTILALAIDAGFASKSTFNDVFKRHTGKTPSAYRRSVAV